ncbi:NAD-dependent epimerase/dehydratase family protein [Xylanibacter caecicola]|uniref:NAD-dependent epimerase/dehydratase family protein n=1 Tax=Xylanibacter caecicola TaxID=2736294 RepID=UPI00258CA0C9|nr:NAD-dependent epimerase/dehydratase family protein [Xylanibacter caecicola]
MKVLVTGAAGFIGSYVIRHLAMRGDDVTGIDSINDYYDTRLKYARLDECGIRREDAEWDMNITTSSQFSNLRFIRMQIEDTERLDMLFRKFGFDKVINLAAQAGVRYSIDNPAAYMRSNLDGFLNILECCSHHKVKHLVYASSSSVYGKNNKTPFCESDRTDTPMSLYAASKKSDELMAHCYSNLYGLRTTGLRYFTVYGPWGRPDMAPMLFADAISHGKPIKMFNGGYMTRDFTYIDDIVEGTIRVLDCNDSKADGKDNLLYEIYNIGCSHPVRLTEFIAEMEKALARTAIKEIMPMQPGDVCNTFADTSKFEKDLGELPKTPLHEGIGRFAKWYKSDKNPLRDIL